MEIHEQILDKFDDFIKRNIVPNILLYGPSGSGKKHLIDELLRRIYVDSSIIETNVMYINCINGKGISFVRNEVKQFAKTNMNSRYFKSIVLLMIDKLTLDAQSALRRCIELYNHNTRFFAVVQNKEFLIQPLISRFCDLYINQPRIDGVRVNLHDHFRPVCRVAKEGDDVAKNIISEELNGECMAIAQKLYEKGIMGDDIIERLESSAYYNIEERVSLMMYIKDMKQHIRSEVYYIFMLIYLCQIRRDAFLNNIR